VARGEREILDVTKQIRARQMEERCAERLHKLASIAKNNTALCTAQQYPIILADSPWHLRVHDSVSGAGRTAESHYPSMQTEEICAMPISKLAAEDAVLFLWTTSPNLQEAFRVAWGFRYVTNVVWVKDKTGLGFWVLFRPSSFSSAALVMLAHGNGLEMILRRPDASPPCVLGIRIAKVTEVAA
jgi:hypothetical protein